MASEFTKGPWQVENTPGDWGLRGSAYISNMGGSDIAIVTYKTPYCMGASEKDKAAYSEAQANARLIAAAPELLEALKYMYDSARELSCECFELGAIQAAKEAIAKAEGTHE